MTPAWIVPDWPVPAGVRAASSLRIGGVSPPPWHTLNLSEQVGDDPARVAENRRLLAAALALPEAPAWLRQVHGCAVLRFEGATLPADLTGDGAVTGRHGRVLAVLTADCLPVLFCRTNGGRIGIAHAGWRGLASGVLEATFRALEAPADEVMAWIGPGIGKDAYEVGAEVREACLTADAEAGECFSPRQPGHWMFDLAGFARRRLESLGLAGVYGGQWCTFSDATRFYSHRRDGRHDGRREATDRPTGRMATLLWLERRFQRLAPRG
jgi:polyphenol oxidase